MQETIEITLPVTSTKVVLKGFVSGRVRQELQNALLGDQKIKVSEKDTAGDNVEISFDSISKANNVAISRLVLSVGDVTGEGVLDAVLDLPEKDYDFVIQKVNAVSAPLAQAS